VLERSLISTSLTLTAYNIGLTRTHEESWTRNSLKIVLLSSWTCRSVASQFAKAGFELRAHAFNSPFRNPPERNASSVGQHNTSQSYGVPTPSSRNSQQTPEIDRNSDTTSYKGNNTILAEDRRAKPRSLRFKNINMCKWFWLILEISSPRIGFYT